jgi:hypothetical protein
MQILICIDDLEFDGTFAVRTRTRTHICVCNLKKTLFLYYLTLGNIDSLDILEYL